MNRFRYLPRKCPTHMLHKIYYRLPHMVQFLCSTPPPHTHTHTHTHSPPLHPEQSNHVMIVLTIGIKFIVQAVPYFFVLIVIEAVVRWLQSKPLPRLNDSINSISAGLMMQLCRLLIGVIEVTSYAWVYEHFRIVDLPWDSPLTWWLAFLGVDCGYYWFHRMAHGVCYTHSVRYALDLANTKMLGNL